jgi:hypothetical protein
VIEGRNSLSCAASFVTTVALGSQIFFVDINQCIATSALWTDSVCPQYIFRPLGRDLLVILLPLLYLAKGRTKVIIQQVMQSLRMAET